LESQDKTRRYHAVAEPLTPDRVLKTHRERSVVICNTVRRAREMASELRQRSGDKNEVILLHSQFLREDRDRIEDRIRQDFGKDSDSGGSLIIVTTQAIEVGVDITSTAMHTELAPANAIIQRAGRCARYPRNEGDVYVYEAVYDRGEHVQLTEKPAPYMGDRQREQMARAFKAFRERSGDALSFDDEQAVIDIVHGSSDREMLNALDADAASHRQSMFAAMRGDLDHVGELVRHVISQPVTIHDEPNSEAVLENPYRLPSFNLHPGTLRGMVKDWLARYHALSDDDAPPFAVKYLHSDNDPDDSTRQLYRWVDMPWTDAPPDAEDQRPRPQLPMGALVVVHPKLATYSSVWGFLPEEGGDTVLTPPHNDDDKAPPPHQYQLETYAEHIDLVYQAAFKDWRERGHTAYWRELEWAAHQLAARLELPYEQVRQAAELTVLLHDVGKLGTGWQKWVREYQAAIGKPTDPGEAYAHTDSTTAAHRAVEKGMRKRPPHAVESAVGAAPLLMTLPERLRQAAFTAICRHHGAFTSQYTPFQLEPFAPDKVSATFEGLKIHLRDGKVKEKTIQKNLVQPPKTSLDTFFAYALFARLLRRSDTKGTMWNSPSYESRENG
jgi:CRISPR-associated endonuclease/helicase Cas3